MHFVASDCVMHFNFAPETFSSSGILPYLAPDGMVQNLPVAGLEPDNSRRRHATFSDHMTVPTIGIRTDSYVSTCQCPVGASENFWHERLC